jgi:hypothetical protein
VRLGIDLTRLRRGVATAQAEPEFLLWREHWAAWYVFLSSGTQWRLAVGLGGALWLGLDYTGLDVVRRACGITDTDWPEVFEQVQVLETEALAVRNRK